MATETRTVTLAEIADEALDYVDQVHSLDPSDCEPVICEPLTQSLAIVDGFHRTAGMVRWAREQGLDLAEVTVRVVVSDAADLVATAAEPGPEQEQAIETLYRLAGVID